MTSIELKIDGLGVDGALSDDELCAQALAADPNVELDRDAVSLWELAGSDEHAPLPDWYMPAPIGGARVLRGWRRWVVSPVILSFLVITAYGLCNTYGQLHF